MLSVYPVSFYPVVKKLSVFLLALLTTMLAAGQIDLSIAVKISPTLRHKLTGLQPTKSSLFIIGVSDTLVFKSYLEGSPTITIKYKYLPASVFVVNATWADILRNVLPRKEVLFVDEQRVPHEEVAVSNLDISANKANLVHRLYPQYNGATTTVSVKENRPDTADIDFHNRYLSTPLESATLSSHATIMATITAGAGNTYYEGKGVAPGATITSANFSTLLPEPDAVYQQFNITVQNHSYGTGIENFYGADASAYDASVIARPQLQHVFSAGNSGAQTSTSGAYMGTPGYANITGSFKMAKNIITTGHTDSAGIVLAASSKGPAFDGRIKPELVAFGEDGSSGAAAIVSGISLVLQHGYKVMHGTNPSSALTRALLLNSADDAGTKGIDFTSGFGTANAFKAMRGLLAAQFFQNSIAHAATQTYDLAVPANIKQLKITLAWNDPPAAPNATKALRNDLDLELFLPATAQAWSPWVLNHFPHPDSLAQLPVRRRDSLNNTEQVTIDNPAAGNYQIRVKGYNVTVSSPQGYAIAYQADTTDRFAWQYPSALDNFIGGRAGFIRWESTYAQATGILEYSIDNGSTWRQVSDAVDLARGYYRWNAPDTFALALLRMGIASQTFISDTFSISKRINTFVGFNCPDSFLFYWNKVPGVQTYQVYRLGSRYMEPLLITADTFVVLAKVSNPSLYYAVAPMLTGKTGLRSYGFNYTSQGVECYIRSFFASLVNNMGQLDLLLGTTYNITRIVVEKFNGTSYQPVQQITVIPGVDVRFLDSNLTTGLNVYRIRIELAGGTVIYSSPETIYYFSGSNYIVYPNPVQQTQDINVLTANTTDITTLQVLNMVGQKILQQEIDDVTITIPAGKLAKGLYFFRFISANGHQEVKKVIVQ